jgi:predicted O-methyltransferase YrrM
LFIGITLIFGIYQKLAAVLGWIYNRLIRIHQASNDWSESFDLIFLSKRKGNYISYFPLFSLQSTGGC